MKTRSKFVSAVLALVVVAALGSQSSVARESSAHIGEFNFSGDAVVLPLVKDSTHPKVVVDIGDGEHYEFIVDTGAGVNVIDSSIAESLGYEVIGEMEIGAPGGPQIPGNIVKVPLVRVGDATIENAEFVTMDISGFSGGLTQGVIGIGKFSDYLVEYNIRRGNPAVPYPIDFTGFQRLATRLGYGEVRLLALKSSRYHREMYSCLNIKNSSPKGAK